MNVLVLTGRYRPKMSANGVCVDNVIHQIQRDGNNVTCICYDDKLTCTSMDVDIIRISRGLLHNTQYKLESKESEGARFILKVTSLVERVKMLLCVPLWPWQDPLYTHRVYKVADRVVREKGIDVVIAVHMPISSIIVGAKIKQNYQMIHFYPYFLDSLSGGRPLSLFSVNWNIKKKLKWEKRLLPYADRIVVMESSRTHHEKYSSEQSYYNRFVFLDVPLLIEHPNAVYENPFDTHYINVLYCGTADYPMRNLRYFSDCVKTIGGSNIRFIIIGNCNCRHLFEDINVKCLPSMSHDMLLPYLIHADAYINFGVRTPSAISGKIFEYMAYGKPIISTFSIDDEACIPYLKEYPSALLIDEREDNPAVVGEKIVDFLNTHINDYVDTVTLRERFYRNTPQAFVDEVLNK